MLTKEEQSIIERLEKIAGKKKKIKVDVLDIISILAELIAFRYMFEEIAEMWEDDDEAIE